MKKIVFGVDFGVVRSDVSYEWESRSNESAPSNPVMTTIGNGIGWAKETHGPITIKAVPGRTTVLISGPGGWKINGPEMIG